MNSEKLSFKITYSNSFIDGYSIDADITEDVLSKLSDSAKKEFVFIINEISLNHSFVDEPFLKHSICAFIEAVGEKEFLHILFKCFSEDNN